MVGAMVVRIVGGREPGYEIEPGYCGDAKVMSHGFEIVQTLITDIEPPEQPRPRRRNRERMQQLDSYEFVL
uniref:Uncharacterized protein n=1 Tax=Chenopodium quinoa TaxID=63459 RepID=A0A803MR36_CHEQI